ncbi:hypothetical protein Fmac_007236 [Flemingia macrophylla]|uniref:Uncharacterized protein n=1 Tax=Flemingia macrophylla TaxID=520843 RepID=A0ABD1NCY4_9FABA
MWFPCLTRCPSRSEANTMGNAWFGFGKKRNTKAVVNPVVQGVTIKVRMTRAQLQDLTEKVDISNANSEFGRLIVQECAKGRFRAHVVASGSESPNMYSRLSPIQENTYEE